MAVELHEYPVTVNWTGGRDGSGDLTPTQSGHTIPINVAPEFGGPGGQTNPEDLLTSAIAGCYSITLGIVLKNRQLPAISIRTEAVGRVEQQGLNFRFQTVTLRPTITMEAEATDEQVTQAVVLARKADAYCIITKAVRGEVEIVVEPTVIRS